MADLRMPMINAITISGNLTKDPTYRQTTNGTPVANFPLACSRKFKDSTGAWCEDVCYVGIVAWYKLADSCYENLNKGSAILVEGELQSKSWKLDNGHYKNLVEIKAKRIQFLNKKSKSAHDDGDDSTADYTKVIGADKLDVNPLAADSNLDKDLNIDNPSDSDESRDDAGSAGDLGKLNF